MGRPRSFEEGAVVERALGLFWEKGFEATSISDLEHATGLGRASLYGSFGDKEAIFERALSLYVERAGALAEGACKVVALAREAGTDGEAAPAATAPLTRLRALLEAQLAGTCADHGPRGCFLQLSAGAPGQVGERARALFEAARASTLRLIEGLLEEARRRGDLRPETEPAAAARYLHVVLQGIAAAARTGLDRAELRPVIDQALRTL